MSKNARRREDAATQNHMGVPTRSGKRHRQIYIGRSFPSIRILPGVSFESLLTSQRRRRWLLVFLAAIVWILICLRVQLAISATSNHSWDASFMVPWQPLESNDTSDRRYEERTHCSKEFPTPKVAESHDKNFNIALRYETSLTLPRWMKGTE